MKKLFLLKSLSRSVHDDHQDHSSHQENEAKNMNIADGDGICTTVLTVWRKSLIINCNGFTVFNSHGDLAFRVDNYIVRPHELILMDGSGKSILTMHRRKKLGLGDSWVVYEGEVGRCRSTTTKITKKPIWSVKKHVSILQGNDNVLAHVYRGSSSSSTSSSSSSSSSSSTEKKNYSYVIEGSYTHRSCKMVDESRKVAAEIKKKDSMIGGVSFGDEVFVLVVQPGFDPGFAMALVLLLDQMFS